MGRTYSYVDLVRLPKLDGMSAQALGAQVLLAAKNRQTPAPAAGALAELESAHRALKTAAANRLPTTLTADPARSKAADQRIDACWSALFDILNGWSKAPEPSFAETAAAVLAQVFPEGLKFVLLPYKLEWAESSTRLAIIKDRKLDESIDKFGAAPLLKWLRAAHKEYGDAIGITSAAPPPATVVSLREAMDDFQSALRRYVVCVSASVGPNDPKSAELAQHLLQPIESWEGTSTEANDGPQPEPAPPPPGGPAAMSAAEPAGKSTK
jgi:hypothetical protein